MQFCTVDVINFIFRLGVVFAIFGFLWWLINLGLSLLRGGRRKTETEAYIIKFVRYLFLVDVTVMFCLDESYGQLSLNKAIMAGLVLLMYFIGKLQNAQLRTNMVRFQGVGAESLLQQFKPVFNIKLESIVIGISVVVFALLLIFPAYASNPISLWFYESIIDIEDTPVFGFIFKVIGFFFMLSIFMKLAQGLLTLLTGGKVGPPPNRNRFDDDGDNSDHDDFDDYEEIK